MITLHDHDVEDWDNNGVCILYPTNCLITEVAGGQYDLEMVHPITGDGRALAIRRGMLIKAPCPARVTPLITLGAQESGEHKVWEAYFTSGGYAAVRSSPATSYSAWSGTTSYSSGAKCSYGGKSYSYTSPTAGSHLPPGVPLSPWTKIATPSHILAKLKNHEEIVYLKAVNATWAQVTTKKGITGYILSSRIRYVRTDSASPSAPETTTVIPTRQVRDQLFRVYSVMPNSNEDELTVRARHVFYDLMGNFPKTYSPSGVPLQTALDNMAANLVLDHLFSFYTNITSEIKAEWAKKNAVNCLLDPDVGAAAKKNAEVVRDNFDVFLLKAQERDRGYTIVYSKNMLGFEGTFDEDSVVTCYMPYGTDVDGKDLYLPEMFIESPHIDDYATIRALPLKIDGATEKKKSGKTEAFTKEQCYEKMRDAIQDQFDKGADLPKIELHVEFIDLGDTVEFADLKNLQQCYIYDTLAVRHGPFGLAYKIQMTGYVFDAILEHYKSIDISNKKLNKTINQIASFQLPEAGVSLRKISPEASTELATTAVTAADAAEAAQNTTSLVTSLGSQLSAAWQMLVTGIGEEAASKVPTLMEFYSQIQAAIQAAAGEVIGDAQAAMAAATSNFYAAISAALRLAMAEVVRVDADLGAYKSDMGDNFVIVRDAEGNPAGSLYTFPGSDYAIKIDNQRVQYLYKGEVASYNSAGKFVGNEVEVEDRLAVGNPTDGYFDWIPSSFGLLLKKRGLV